MKMINGFPTYDNADEYDNAMADWHQTGFELSLLKDSDPDYKEMMDKHMGTQPAMSEEVFYGHAFKPVDLPKGNCNIPF